MYEVILGGYEGILHDCYGQRYTNIERYPTVSFANGTKLYSLPVSEVGVATSRVLKVQHHRL